MPKLILHYLVSLEMQGGHTAHCYLVTQDHSNCSLADGLIAEIHNKYGNRSLSPRVFGTILHPDAVTTVSKILVDYGEIEVQSTKEFSGFYILCWQLPTESPDNQVLLGLH